MQIIRAYIRAGVMAEDKKPFERLPTNVVPRNYKVELTPDLKAFTFRGVLDVTAEVSDMI
jgi:puromycin-sensitive aminopeptidase